jgi:hypothetical protein
VDDSSGEANQGEGQPAPDQKVEDEKDRNEQLGVVAVNSRGEKDQRGKQPRKQKNAERRDEAGHDDGQPEKRGHSGVLHSVFWTVIHRSIRPAESLRLWKLSGKSHRTRAILNIIGISGIRAGIIFKSHRLAPGKMRFHASFFSHGLPAVRPWAINFSWSHTNANRSIFWKPFQPLTANC